MPAMFRPCIDLHNGKVKQIVGGSLTDSGSGLHTNFVSALPPEYYAKLYAEYGLAGGHVIMLGPGNISAARQALAGWPDNLQIGGGITAGNAKEWLDCGAQKVIVTSFIFSDGRLQLANLEKLFAVTGREHLVLDLSCRKRGEDYFVVTDRWQKFSEFKVNAENLSFLAGYADEFLIHAVDVEGRQSGIDGELLKKLAAESPAECVYAGGISSLSDIETIEKYGEGKIHYTIGSALDIFGGNMPFKEIAERSRNVSNGVNHE